MHTHYSMIHRVNYFDDRGVKEALADFESLTAEVLVVAVRKFIVDSWHRVHHAANTRDSNHITLFRKLVMDSWHEQIGNS